jgi:hypothetical protein
MTRWLTPALMVASACTLEQDVGHNDAVPGGEAETLEVRTVVLTSGLAVDVRGPAAELDRLPDPVSAAQLCEEYAVSLTAIFDESLAPKKVAASAVWRELVGKEALPPFPPDFDALREYLAPLFPSYVLPNNLRKFGGFSSNPIAVFPVPLVEDAYPLPQALVAFSHDTVFPMAVFNHSPEGPYLAFPSTWMDIPVNDAGATKTVWSRYIDGQDDLDQCAPYTEAIAKTMRLSVVDELATCGDLMARPYSLPDPSVGGLSGSECVTPSRGVAVTLSPVLVNGWGTIDCPRPPEARFDYVCFGQ